MSRPLEIAAAAAALVVEQGLEYAAAKRRAARDIGGRPELPSNEQVEDAVREHLAVFCADTQPAELRALREVALQWMQRLAEFRPHLAGVAWRGTATVSAAPAHDSATMAMTAALAEAGQWPGYARWLPEVAASVAAVDGAAFGMRGLMQQNLQNSAALAQAAREHREWSARTWGQVAADRHASDARRQHANRELLGNVQTHANPFDGSRVVDLPTSHRHYWVDRQGRVLGTDDPGADPNHGSTGEWRRMPRVQP